MTLTAATSVKNMFSLTDDKVTFLEELVPILSPVKPELQNRGSSTSFLKL